MRQKTRPKCGYCTTSFSKINNNQKYCSEHCAERMLKIKKALYGKKIRGTDKFRACSRCKKKFKHWSMKKNCLECLELLAKNPNNYKKKSL